MDRDERTNNQAKSIVQSLSSVSIPAKHIQLGPVPITPTFFSDRIPVISKDISERIFNALKENHIIVPYNELSDKDSLPRIPIVLQTEKYYYVATNPRRSNWRSIVSQIISADIDTLINDESAISELMNVAYAQHEISRDGLYDAINFCLSNQH